MTLASGGIETVVAGYRYHHFVDDGTLTVGQGGVCDLVYIGGGGGGGGANYGTFPGAGGGGGEVKVLASYEIAAGYYSIVIGRGGAGGPTGELATQVTYPAANGGATTITGIGTAQGGGAGANISVGGDGVTQAGQDGSSGGGGASNQPAGLGTVGEGYDGGAGRTTDPFNSGGGGGAGGVGDSAVDVALAQGGAGVEVAQFADFGDGGWFGSGGGGGRWGPGDTSFASRPGGGGLGSGPESVTPDLYDGQDGTGGGGGGARSQQFGLQYRGGDGGDGAVYLRYAIVEPEFDTERLYSGIEVTVPVEGDDGLVADRVLTYATEKRFQIELAGPGSGSFRLHRDDPAREGIAVGTLVWMVLFSRPRFGMFVERVRRVVDEGEDASAWYEYSGRGTLSILETAILAPDGDGIPERPFLGVSPASVMLTALGEAQTRGAIPDVVPTFTSSLGTDNVLLLRVVDLSERAGRSLLELAGKHQQYVDVWMDHLIQLNYAAERGNDHTDPDSIFPLVRLSVGDRVLGGEVETVGQVRNALLMEFGEGEFDWRLDAASETEWGRREALLSAGNAASAEMLDLTAEEAFARLAQPTDTVAFDADFLSTGHMRFVPFIDYGLGDWILVDLGDGVGDRRVRVRSFTCHEDDEGPHVVPEVATTAAEFAARLERLVRARQHGAAGGTVAELSTETTTTVASTTTVTTTVDSGIVQHLLDADHLTPGDATALAEVAIGDADLGDLGDVHVPAPANDQVLTWRDVNSRWEARTPTGGGGGGGGGWPEVEPGDISSILFHLDVLEIVGLVDNDEVAQWDDLSVEANHYKQATSGNRPLYKTNVVGTLPAVRFDNVNDWMAADPQVNVAVNPLSVAYVAKYNAVASAERRIINGSNNWLMGPYNTHWRTFTGAFDTMPLLGQATTGTLWAHIVVQRTDRLLAVAMPIYREDDPPVGFARQVGVRAATPGLPGDIRLGASGAFAQVANSDLFAVAAWTKVLTDGELEGLLVYWQTRFGSIPI